MTSVGAWHAARGRALARLEQLARQIRQSDDPEATEALADIAPMIRLLSNPVADLVTVRAIEARWRNEPAWLDLQYQAPDIFEPLHQALKQLGEGLRHA